ncbi:MAG: hypothetical protein ACK4EY_15115 [Flavipsychrobacter sp.]
MAKQKTPPVGQATEDQIKNWKAKYTDGIYQVVLRGHVGYFRNPDVEDMNAAASMTQSSAPLDYYKYLGKDTHIGGSEVLFDGTDRAMFLGFIETIKPKIDGKKGELLDL